MTQPITIPPPPTHWLIDEELALTYLEFQERNPLMKLGVTPADGLLLLGVIKLFIQSSNCPDRSRDRLCKIAEEVQSLFEPDMDMARLTGLTLREIQAIREKKQGQIRRIESMP